MLLSQAKEHSDQGARLDLAQSKREALEPVLEPVLVPALEPVLEPVLVPVLEPVLVPVLEPVLVLVLEPVLALGPVLVPVPVCRRSWWHPCLACRSD